MKFYGIKFWNADNGKRRYPEVTAELQLMLSLTKYLMGCTMNIYITLVNVLKDIST